MCYARTPHAYSHPHIHVSTALGIMEVCHGGEIIMYVFGVIGQLSMLSSVHSIHMFLGDRLSMITSHTQMVTTIHIRHVI
jgi:hypothetical protein